MVQSLVVGIAVVACFIYAAWTLMPQVLRKTLAGALLKPVALQRFFPQSLKLTLMRAAQAQPGCGGGCHGCESGDDDKVTAKTNPALKPLVFQPRKPQR